MKFSAICASKHLFYACTMLKFVTDRKTKNKIFLKKVHIHMEIDNIHHIVEIKYIQLKIDKKKMKRLIN